MPKTLSQLSSTPVAAPDGRRARRRTGTGLRSVAVLAALAMVLVACSSDSEAAVSVGADHVSSATVSSELATIAKNPTVKQRAVVDGKLDPAVAAAWLTLIIQTEVAKAANEKAGTKIIKADREEAKNWAAGYFGDPDTFTKFPKSFQTSIVKRYEDVPAYVRTHTPKPTAAEIKSSYDESLVRNCASRRYVSHILVTSEEAAKAAAAQIAAGADFKTVASKSSSDTQSASRGGALGCLDGQGIDPTFQAAAAALPIGGVSAPVKTQYGWHVIKVEDVATALPFDSVKDEIRTDLVEQGPAGRSKLQKAMAAAKVTLASKYGSWVVKDGTGKVTPPKSASTSTTTQPSSSSSTTTTTKP